MKTFEQLFESVVKPLGANHPDEDHNTTYNNLHKNKTLTHSEKSALGYYADEDHERINSAHRNNNVDDYTSEQSKHLDSAIAKHTTDHPITLWRGVHKNAIDNMKLEQGSYFEDKGYISTSTNPKIAKGFSGSGKHIFRITLPKGAKAVHLPNYMPGRSEKEVILPRNSKFRYYGKTKHNDITVHHMTLLKSKK